LRKLSLCYSIVYWCTKIRAVLTGWSTVSGFDLAWFSSLTSEHICVCGLYCAIYILKKIFAYNLISFSELSLEGLALNLVD